MSADEDTDYFTDADLSVLGQGWDVYSTYAKNVMKKYAVFPDLLYNPSRKKVLNHFLEMQVIFKTAYFHEKFELQAKHNLRQEMEQLQA